MTDNVSKVGFYYTSSPVSGFDGYTAADESSVVYSQLSYNGSTYSAEGSKVFGTVLSDISGLTSVYVYTFCETADGIYYSAPVEVQLS